MALLLIIGQQMLAQGPSNLTNLYFLFGVISPTKEIIFFSFWTHFPIATISVFSRVSLCSLYFCLLALCYLVVILLNIAYWSLFSWLELLHTFLVYLRLHSLHLKVLTNKLSWLNWYGAIFFSPMFMTLRFAMHYLVMCENKLISLFLFLFCLLWWN